MVADLQLLELALDLLTDGQQMPDHLLGNLLSSLGVGPLALPSTISTLRNAQHWELLTENVVGWGIGPKSTAGRLSDELSLKIYVREKRPLRDLVAEQIVPKLFDLAGIGQIPTDLEAIGQVELEALSARLRPVPCGYSIGHRTAEAGSIGCLVHRRGDPGKAFILSCSHILAASGTGQQGDAVLQPGPADGGTAGDTIARLAAWVPFDFAGQYVNRVDAAIAGPISGAECQPDIALIGLFPRGVKTAHEGMKVQKVGRSTHHTWGAIKDTRFRTMLKYPRPGGGTDRARFRDLCLCTRFTAKGDSGSLVLDENGYAVGLHFAGTALTSIFCPIQSVLDVLNVDLVTRPI